MYKSKEQIREIVVSKLFCGFEQDEMESNQLYQDDILNVIHQIRQDDREALIEELSKMMFNSCDCVGEKYSCEHWGANNVIDQIVYHFKQLDK